MSFLLSIIIPCFNEESNVENCYSVLKKTTGGMIQKFDLEIIFVDDGSQDQTCKIIENLHNKDKTVKLIELSRNFGKEEAIAAGVEYAKGDCVLFFDADRQYPAEKIPEFIKKWQEGCEVVIGIRDRKNTTDLLGKIGSYFFYRLLKMASETDILPGALDFRLIDKKVVKELRKFTERGRMTRALIDWLGFNKCYIYYTEKERENGDSTFSSKKRFKLAIDTLLAHSLLPLKLVGLLGVLIIAFSGTLGFFAFINQFVLDTYIRGFFLSGSFLLGLLNIFLIGMVMTVLGLISFYIGNIYNEVIGRPLYVVKSKKL